MNDYSMAIVVGRLTHDPELKYTTPGGIPYLRLTISVRVQDKTAADESCPRSPRKTTHLIDVCIWRRLAELCAQFLKQGRAVMVIGSLRSGRWIARDGKRRSRVEIRADRVQFLGPRESEGVADAGKEKVEALARESAGEAARTACADCQRSYGPHYTDCTH